MIQRRSIRKKRQTEFFGMSNVKKRNKHFTEKLKSSSFTFMFNHNLLPVTADEIIDSEYNNLLHNNLLSLLGSEYLKVAPEWFTRKYKIYKLIREFYIGDFSDPPYLENLIL